LEWQFDWLVANGVGDVVVIAGYKGEMVREFLRATVSKLNVVCVREDPDHLLGTGGALRLGAELGALAESFVVVYGDSYLPIAIRPTWEVFMAMEVPGLLTVWRNDNRSGRSNVVFENGLVRDYNKANPSKDFRYVDYGLCALQRSEVVLAKEAGEVWDLGELFRDLARAGRLGGYEVYEPFLEIGSESGLAELEKRLSVDGGVARG
jgi:NDP-sugar pyrophosphorylase family protein